MINLLVIRHLGPSEYGYYSYCMGLMATVSLLAFLSPLDQIMLRDMVRSKNRTQLINLILGLKLCGFVLSFVLILLFPYFAGDEGKNIPFSYLLFTWLTGIVVIRDLFKTYLFAQQRIARVAKLNIYTYILSSVLRLLGIHFELPLNYFFVVLITEIVFSIVMISFSVDCLKKIRPHVSRRWLKKQLIHSWPLLLTTLSGLAFSRFDQFFLFKYQGVAQLGIYASLTWIIDRGVSVVALPMISLFPYVTSVHNDSPEKFGRILRSMYHMMTLLGLPMVAGGVLFGTKIANFLYGDKFAIPELCVPILGLIFLFSAWGLLNQRILIITHELKIDLINSSISALISVSLMFLLIPNYGLTGAAIASVTGHGFYLIVQTCIRRTRHYIGHMLSGLPVPCAAVLVAASISSLISLWYLAALVFSLVYGVLIALAIYAGITPAYAGVRSILESYLQKKAPLSP